MITAVDANILIYVLAARSKYGPNPLEVVRLNRKRGRLVASDVVGQR